MTKTFIHLVLCHRQNLAVTGTLAGSITIWDVSAQAPRHQCQHEVRSQDNNFSLISGKETRGQRFASFCLIISGLSVEKGSSTYWRWPFQLLFRLGSCDSGGTSLNQSFSLAHWMVWYISGMLEVEKEPACGLDITKKFLTSTWAGEWQFWIQV